MEAERCTFGKGTQPAMRRAACAKIVLRMHFKPGRNVPARVDAGRHNLKRLGIMLRLEADPCASGEGQQGWHIGQHPGGTRGRQAFGGTGLALPALAVSDPPIFTHSPLPTYFQALP